MDFSNTIGSMLVSGYHKWGYVIYRCTYGDDKAWNDFMTMMKYSANQSLEWCGRAVRLGPYLRFTVLEDPSFDNATKDAIREHFRHWIQGRSAERDGTGADGPRVLDRVPRYRHCVYVDKECLDSVRKSVFPSAEAAGKSEPYSVDGFAVLIDSDFGHRPPPLQEEPDSEDSEEDDDDDYGDEVGPVGGTSELDVGWTYVDVGGGFIGSYDSRAWKIGGWDEIWRLCYEQPSAQVKQRNRRAAMKGRKVEGGERTDID